MIKAKDKKTKEEKVKKDKVLRIGKSPLRAELYNGWEGEEEVIEMTGSIEGEDETLIISGDLGKGGHPVTVTITDEFTGQEMEIAHVKNALIMIEDQRANSSGWLSLLIGDVKRVGEVLAFLAKATVKELKRMVRNRR